MTKPLSPAAQAVLKAFLNSPEEADVEGGIAAALRTAAEQLGYGKTDSLVVSCEDILAIAEELEGSGA